MLVHSYDSISKEYLFTLEADIDQLESELAGKPVYLIPKDATDVRPLADKEGYTQCFDVPSRKWFYVEDHRGKTVYSKDDLSSLIISTIGAIPNGYIEDLPQMKNKYQIWFDGEYRYPDIDTLRAMVKNDLDDAYEDKVATPYKFNDFYVQPSWATIYTNTLVAMKEDLDMDGNLDNEYKILLIVDPVAGGFHHLAIKSIDEFMPYYNKVKQLYKQITEDYHDKIIKIASIDDPEAIVSLILNY